ncbi:plasminogen activator, urokinase b [Chanos chanos]|uniref:trypsin n=1 Tax=Chanos chanos TaxID=29144 RepID=A0A6J2VFX1_CHACN|nr:urokinase-type plasminogen activator-like [Chanos chanos]
MSERVFGTDIRYLGLGKHNYCRNPDYSRKPWCYVRSPFGAMKEYCNIPHCAREPKSTGDRTNGPNTQFKCGERPGKLMKVVGGLITPVETHPWMAAIFKRRSNRNEVFHCGGSLISPCWVLTAAHCFPDGLHEKAHKFSVYLGKNAINETDESREQKFKVTDVILHENFDDTEGNFNNDIALLRISGRNGECAVETRSARTVCLAPQGHSLTAGVTCEIAGYGKERQGLWYNSQYLREGKVNLLAQDLCSSKSYYGSMITDNMVCAGSPDWTTDACKGDSGGPLVCTIENRLFLYGIISWGEGCSREFRPGVYTRVTNYNEWIEQKTGLAIKSGNAYP